jgi:hypothetical protein
MRRSYGGGQECQPGALDQDQLRQTPSARADRDAERHLARPYRKDARSVLFDSHRSYQSVSPIELTGTRSELVVQGVEVTVNGVGASFPSSRVRLRASDTHATRKRRTLPVVLVNPSYVASARC